MFRLILHIAFLLSTATVFSQHLAAFHDYRKHFIVFDDGKLKELEHLPVQSFKVGGHFLAYVSNSGEFKVYHQGIGKTLCDQFVGDYYASPDLLVFKLYSQLYVFENGEVQLLSGHVKDFLTSDSLVAFYNENTRSSHIYYKGKVHELERSLVGSPVVDLVAGDNLFAYYNSNTRYLKAFYHGKNWNILQSPSRVPFLAGRNMLAYIDKSRNSLHLFNHGEVFDLEDYEPRSMQIGDDLLAYIDNLGSLKVFYDGQVHTISTFEPDFYNVKDSLMVFAEMGYLKVFYKGSVSEFGNFVPADYQVQESTMAFVGPNGWLQAFSNGRFIKVTSDLISTYSVNYNIISINTTVNKVKVYYQGKIYDTY